MAKSIAVLTLTIPRSFQESSCFSALKITAGDLPRYFLFPLPPGKRGTVGCNDLREVNEFLKDALLFTLDKQTDEGLESLAEIDLDFKEVIHLREVIAILYPTLRKLSLEDICRRLGIKTGKKFYSPAQQECRLAWNILKHCLGRLLKADIGYLSQLQSFIQGLSCEQFLAQIIKEIGKTYPDRAIRTGLSHGGQAEALFNEEENCPAEEEIIVSAEWVVNCFRSGGLLAQHLPGYEDRTIQITMARDILSGFRESKAVIIEAGTGTGKSIAYLIPALWWARKNKKRVVIATHTITLQEQLFGKDLPFLRKILPFRFTSALLKGKNNYACLNSFYHDPLHTEQASAAEKIALAGMFNWLRETATGDLGELPYSPEYSPVWKRYGADNYCAINECRFARECFMLRAKKKAEAADLIVINHSLLLADVKTNHKSLPEYSDLVIDEAHHLYQAALKQLGFELSYEQMNQQLEKIKTRMYYQLKKSLPVWKAVFPYVNWPELESWLEKIPESCSLVLEQTRELFQLGRQLLAGHTSLRLDKEKLGTELYTAFTVVVENLSLRLKDIIAIFDRINTCLATDSDQLDAFRYEAAQIKNELAVMTDGLSTILAAEGNTRVTYWEKTNSLYLKNTVIDVAGILQEHIFAKNNCTILTSATLSVAASFSYFARDIGLTDYHSLRLASPFDYDKQMLFCVVNDLSIQQWSEEDLAFKAAALIAQIAEVMQGRTLVLFTSYRYLRLVRAELLRNPGRNELQILAQGIDGSREDLLQAFVKMKNSVLLGTNSFWEGIDVPGDDLRCVIMAKLPFWPPDSPIMEAKARLLQSRGLDPFQEMHLPEAIIRFKQGFGRLIRTREDKGVVVLLDDRVLKKYYGKSFIRSLPIKSYYQGSSEKIIKEVGRWV